MVKGKNKGKNKISSFWAASGVGLIAGLTLSFMFGVPSLIMSLPTGLLGLFAMSVSFMGILFIAVWISILRPLLHLKYTDFNYSISFFVLGFILTLFLAYPSLPTSIISNFLTNQSSPSYYQGIVEAIYTNNPSSITFTSGLHYQGNLSKVRNLSIGSVCNLTINNTGFSGGSCKAGT